MDSWMCGAAANFSSGRSCAAVPCRMEEAREGRSVGDLQERRPVDPQRPLISNE